MAEGAARQDGAMPRPVMRYHGGKYRLASWIVSHLPAARVRVDAFAGAASVTLAAPRAPVEVINDLSDDVVTVFRVLRDPALALRLAEALRLTPWSRTEFDAASEPTDDAIETARRVIFRSYAGFGGGANRTYNTGFRAVCLTQNSHPVLAWSGYADAIPRFTARLRGVVIEKRDALDLLSDFDNPDTLFYLDPPYLPETRRAATKRDPVYAYDMTRADHVTLLDRVTDPGLQAMIVLSGYPAPLYDSVLAGWHRVTRSARADGGAPRVECLWLNPAAIEALESQHRDLFVPPSCSSCLGGKKPRAATDG